MVHPAPLQNAFAAKLSREFEKVSASIGKTEVGGMAKVLKHLLKRLEYVKHPEHFLEKHVSLAEAFEAFQNSDILRAQMQKAIFEKCISILEFLSNSLHAWSSAPNDSENMQTQASVAKSSHKIVSKTQTPWYIHLLQHSQHLVDLNLQPVLLTLMATLAGVAKSGLRGRASLYFFYFFDILRASLSSLTPLKELQNISEHNRGGSSSKHGTLGIDTSDLRRLASVAFQVAVALMERGPDSFASGFYAHFLAVSFSTQVIERNINIGNTDSKFEAVVFARFHQAFNTFKKILESNALGIDEHAHTLDLQQACLKALSTVAIDFMVDCFPSKTPEHLVTMANLIIGNQARWQRKFPHQMLDCSDVWSAVHKSGRDKSNSMMAFFLKSAFKSYEFYAIAAGDIRPVQELSIKGCRFTQGLIQSLLFSSAGVIESNQVLYYRALNMMQLSAFLLMLPSSFRGVTEESHKLIHRASALIFEGSQIKPFKDSHPRQLALMWNKLLAFITSVSTSKIDEEAVGSLRDAIEHAKMLDTEFARNVLFDWHFYVPTIRLVRYVGTVLGAINEPLLQLKISALALAWERSGEAANVTVLDSVKSVMKSARTEFQEIRYDLARSYFNQGYSSMAETILADLWQNAHGNLEQKHVILSSMVKAAKPRGLDTYLPSLREELAQNSHPLQSKVKHRRLEEAGRCYMMLSQLHDLVGNPYQAWHFAKKADSYFHGTAYFETISHVDDGEDSDLSSARISLSSFSAIHDYLDFIDHMDHLFQKRSMPSCSGPFLQAGVDIASHFGADKLKKYFTFRTNLLHARCKNYPPLEGSQIQKTREPYFSFHAKKSDSLLQDVVYSLGCAEESVMRGQNDRALLSLKHAKHFLGITLKCTGNSFYEAFLQIRKIETKSPAGKFSLKDCSNIRRVEFCRSKLSLSIALSKSHTGGGEEDIEKSIKKCLALTNLPEDKVAIQACEAKLQVGRRSHEYFQACLEHAWPLWIPQMTQQILKGHAALFVHENRMQLAAIAGTMSIGLPYDLNYFSKCREVHDSVKNVLGHDPTQSKFSSTQAHILSEIQEMHEKESWEIVSLYFDDNQGIVLSTFSRGEEPQCRLIPYSRTELDAMQFLFDTMLEENDATLVSAGDIKSTEVEKKKQWWKSRYNLDAKMTEFLSQLDSIIDTPNSGLLAQSFKRISLANACPVILIIDENLQCFPWESTKYFEEKPVTRMPSINSVIANWRRRKKLHFSMSNTSHVVNPEQNLPTTEKNFLNMVADLKTQNLPVSFKDGLVGVKPTTTQIIELLKPADVFVYWGHDSFLKFSSTAKIAKESFECVVFDMGCNSGRLFSQGIFGSEGKVLSLLSGGSPAIVANLWKVSTGDCDVFSERLVQFCSKAAGSRDGAMLGDAIAYAKARDPQNSTKKCREMESNKNKCIKLAALNGAATVVYGLPVLMK